MELLLCVSIVRETYWKLLPILKQRYAMIFLFNLCSFIEIFFVNLIYTEKCIISVKNKTSKLCNADRVYTIQTY